LLERRTEDRVDLQHAGRAEVLPQFDVEAIEVVGPEPVDLLVPEAGHDPALHVAPVGGDRRRRGVLLEVGQPILEEPLQRSRSLGGELSLGRFDDERGEDLLRFTLRAVDRAGQVALLACDLVATRRRAPKTRK